ncbi:hypothetical protein MBLNU459_g8135t1 [Dothideomycetes sp. NU459]
MSGTKAKHGLNPDGVTKKPILTHFLCVPLVTSASRPQLEKSVQRFKEDVCGSAKDSIKASFVSEKAVRPVGAIHLTLGVMSLNPEDLVEAKALLKQVNIADLLHDVKTSQARQWSLEGQISSLDEKPQPNSFAVNEPTAPTLIRPISPPPTSGTPRPLTISLRSLVSMHPPQKTSILYTAPEDLSGRLHLLCLALRTRFQAAGFLVEDKRPLKLHATLVNTIYAKGRRPRGRRQPPKAKATSSPAVSAGEKATVDERDAREDRSQGHGPDAKAPLRMDATAVLERYADYVWAENFELDRVAICEMGAKKVLNDKAEVVGEEYKEVAVLRLPTSSEGIIESL